jgi:hypothetical protein
LRPPPWQMARRCAAQAASMALVQFQYRARAFMQVKVCI